MTQKEKSASEESWEIFESDLDKYISELKAKIKEMSKKYDIKNGENNES